LTIDTQGGSGIIREMKKSILIVLIIGIFLGLLLGGIYWHTKYTQLYEKYYRSVELLRLYKNYVE
jgi:hypothetical protein